MTRIIGKAAQVDEWLSAVQASKTAQADIVPIQFVTMEEFANKIRLSVPGAHPVMRKLIANGLAEKRSFRVVRNGTLKRIPYYALLKKKK